MVMASVNAVDVVATTASVGQNGSTKQADANQSDSDFSQVLSGLGGETSRSMDKPASATATSEVAPVAEKSTSDDKEPASADADVAANLLALCGVPIAPTITLPAAQVATPVASAAISVVGGASSKAPAAVLGLNVPAAETTAAVTQPELKVAAEQITTPTSVASTDASATDTAASTPTVDDAATSSVATELTQTVSNAVTPFDMQWLRSNVRALNAQAGSVGSTLPSTTNALKDATAADVSKLLANSQSAGDQGIGSVQSSGAQNTLAQAAPIMAMLGAQGRDERLELKEAAKTDTQVDTSIALNTAQMQPAGTQLASDSNGIDTSARHQLQSAVGSHQWATELGNKLTLMATKDTQSATLYMTPADLGPVQVRIETNKDQASVWFTADHAETRSALEQSLPKLREMFTAQGMSLTDAGVFGDRSRQQQSQTQPQTNFNTASYDATVTAEDTARVRSISLSLLDAYA